MPMNMNSNCRASPRVAWMLVLVLAWAIFVGGCASDTARSPLRVSQIVEMNRSGAPASSIIAKMQETGSVYRIPASGVAKLRSEGVPEPVLDYMMSTRAVAEREQADECFKWIWCLSGPPYALSR